MASADERFRMPDGSVYIVRPAAESGGAFVEMEFVLPSGCVPPPPHVHAHQVEEYEVLAGRFDLVVEGRWRTLEPGELAEVAVGALHTFRNRSGEPVRVRNQHRPAMRFEEFDPAHVPHPASSRSHAQAATRGAPLYLSMVMLDFEETLAPGRARERLPTVKALASIARLLPQPTA